MILSRRARRCALQLRLENIHRKIAKVEEEIAGVQGGSRSNPGLFEQEHPGLRSLREGLGQFRLRTHFSAGLRPVHSLNLSSLVRRILSQFVFFDLTPNSQIANLMISSIVKYPVGT